MICDAVSTYVVLYLRTFGHRDPYQILSVHFTKDPLEGMHFFIVQLNRRSVMLLGNHLD